jgi:excinuclease UvrABC helicase subunit UvrB
MFDLVSKYKPSGGQPESIEKIVEGIKRVFSNKILKNIR